MKTKKFLVTFLLFVFFLPVISSADLKPVYSFADGNGRAWVIEEGSKKRPDIEIDEDGQVWVICNNSIYRASPEGLIEISHSETEIPSQFASSPNGKLYILWKESNNIVITKITKGKIERIASLDIKRKSSSKAHLYADSAERLWITGNFPTIYFWSDNKWISHKIKPEQFILRDYDRKKKWKDVDFLSIYPIGLSNKMLVFWSRQAPSSYNASLDGFISFSDGEFKYIRGITSLPRGKVASLAPISNGLFWAAIHQGKFYRNLVGDWCDKVGIFEVNIKSGKASSILPAKHPLAKLETLRIIADKEKTKWVTALNKNRRFSSLWQIKENNIDVVIKNIEAGLTNNDLLSGEICCPFLANKNGDIWLGTVHSGAWVKLKENDIWQHADWRSGFPLHSIRRIKEDKAGNIWFCGYDNGLCCLKPEGRKLKRWVKDGSSSNWKAIPPIINRHGQVANEMEFDQNGNPWVVSDKDILCRFDPVKGEWIRFHLKENSEADVLAHDNRGRVWLFSWSSDSDWQTAVFENEEPSYFPSSQSACEFMAKRGENCVMYPDSSNYYNLEFWLSMQDGKACFVYWGNKKWYLNYFDGTNWKLWTIKDVDPNTSKDRWETPPFFNKDGMLCINIQRKSWLWDGKQWKASAYLEGPIKKKERLKSLKYNKQKEMKDKINQLEKFSKDKAKNAFETDDGFMWVQTNFSIYKKADDLLLEINEGKHPLMGNKIESTRMDENGNLYVKTPAGWFVRSADRGVCPETLIETKLVLIEKLPIRFSFSGKDDKTMQEKLRFSWSLDEEKWSSPSYDKTISFDYLSNGEHVLKVKALDEELSYDLTPAVIQFIVKIDAKNLLAETLEMLKSSDYDKRETAVRNLVRIGKDALPELKKLRAESKDDDLRWWINVVIQQIEPGR